MVSGRVEVQETTRLITTHQIHSQSHMDIHYDPSPCSILGVYPRWEVNAVVYHPTHASGKRSAHRVATRIATREGSRYEDRLHFEPNRDGLMQRLRRLLKEDGLQMKALR